MANGKNSKRNTLDRINPVVSILRTIVGMILYGILLFSGYMLWQNSPNKSLVDIVIGSTYFSSRIIINVIYFVVKMESELMNKKPRRIIMLGYLGVRSVTVIILDIIICVTCINVSNVLDFMMLYIFILSIVKIFVIKKIALNNTITVKESIFKWAKPAGLITLLLTSFFRILSLFSPNNYFSEDLNLFKVLFLGFSYLFLIFLILAFEIYTAAVQILYYNNVELKKELLLGKDYKKVDITNESEVESQTKAQS